MATSSSPSSPVPNKIGFHVGPGFDVYQLERWARELDSAGIPIFVTAVSDYNLLSQIRSFIQPSDVEHTLVFNPLDERTAEAFQEFQFGKSDYYDKMHPEEEAHKYWQQLRELLAPISHLKDWIQVSNNLYTVGDRNQQHAQADWLGEFAFEISHLAQEESIKIALFGWQNNQPPSEVWEANGMRRFLSYCSSYPDQIAIALHEFSNDVSRLHNGTDSGIGRFQNLLTATDQQGIPRPTVLITEWGWARDNVPDPERAIAHIREANKLYAQFPEVRGAALWHLGDGYRNIGRKAKMLIEPLTYLSLDERFEAKPETVTSTGDGYDTEPSSTGDGDDTEPVGRSPDLQNDAQSADPDQPQPNDDNVEAHAKRMAQEDGDFTGALQLAQGVSRDEQRQAILLGLAQIAVEKEAFDYAEEVAKRLTVENRRDDAWARIAETAVRLGNLDYARHAANYIEDAQRRDALLAQSEVSPIADQQQMEQRIAQQPDLTVATKGAPPELKGEVLERALPPVEETTPVGPPRVWLYMGSGSDEGQMDILEQAGDVLWGGNPNSNAGDIVLMYRTDPYQDISYLFRARSDPFHVDPEDLPRGSTPARPYAIQLADKHELSRPLPRQEIYAHPQLDDWPLARTPQGAMSHAIDIREAKYWLPLRGLILAWNPQLAPVLANWENEPTADLLQQALAIAYDIPDEQQRLDALLGFIEHVPSTETAVLATLNYHNNPTIARAARDALGKSLQDTFAEAELMAQTQPQQAIRLLQEIDTRWQETTNGQQAKAYSLLASAYETLQQPEQAYSHWRAAVDADSTNTEAFLGAARTAPAPQLEESAELMRQLQTSHPDAPGPDVGLAALAERRDDLETAVSHLQDALAKSDDDRVRRDVQNRLRALQQLLPTPAPATTAPTTTTAAPTPAPGNGQAPTTTTTEAGETGMVETDATVVSAPTTPPPPSLRQPSPRRAPDPDQERRLKLLAILETHFNLNEIEQICFELAVKFENVEGSTLTAKARGLITHMERHSRLPDLENILQQKRPHAFQETVDEIITTAQRLWEQRRFQEALATLQAREAFWQTRGSEIHRAAAHTMMAQAYELINRAADAYIHWKRKAALLNSAADAFEGMGRTAPEEKLDEAEIFIRDVVDKLGEETAATQRGLAIIAQRRGRAQEAIDLLTRARPASLVERKQLENDARRLADDPDTALSRPRLGDITAVRPLAETARVSGNDLSQTLADLSAAAELDPTDQADVIRAFVAELMALPTLSRAHKQELRRRSAAVLADVERTGKITAQAVADLHLPVLDNLFVTQPALRRAFIRAAASYRQRPGRRLRLYLRERARAQICRLLDRDEVSRLMRSEDETAKQQTWDALKTAVFTTGAVQYENDPAADLETIVTQPHDGRFLAHWRAAANADPPTLTISGNLCLTITDDVLAEVEETAGDVWRVLYDLLHNKEGVYEHLDSWGRLRRTTLDETAATLLLHAFHPDEHLPYQRETAESALRNLQLDNNVQALDYQAYIELAQTMLRDDDLGFDSLDDVGCFLQQAATGAITLAPDTPEGDDAPLLPPLANQVQLDGRTVDTGLSLPPGTFEQITSALSAGNHIILIGPPGTGKTTVAQDVCRLAHDNGASRGFVSVTATADWTTFDTVGGYMPSRDGQLNFSEGIVLRSIREQKWLIIDEINRADIDKAFGELFTVLSGQPITLPYRDGTDAIRVLPPGHPRQNENDYAIPRPWRIIGTMNVYDKASLFEMSYAFMRRFAFVDVGIPDDPIFPRLIDLFLRRQQLDDEALADTLQNEIFAQAGAIMANRPLGPAIAQDIIGYVARRRRQTGALSLEYLGEAFLLYAVPQFDGLEEGKIETIYIALSRIFADAPKAAGAIRRRLRELFPQYAASFPGDEEIATMVAQAGEEGEEEAE